MFYTVNRAPSKHLAIKLIYGIDYLTDAEQVEAAPVIMVIQCLLCTGICCAHVPDT